MMLIIRVATLWFTLAAAVLHAQVAPENTSYEPLEESSPALRSLAALSIAVKNQQERLQNANAALLEAKTNLQKEQLQADILRITEELATLQQKFMETAAGVDISPFVVSEAEPFSWENEVGKLITPVIDELQSATSTSRQLSELRKEEAYFRQRETTADAAIGNLEALIEAATNPSLEAQLRNELAMWEEREESSRNRADAALLQLQNLESQTGSLLESSTSFVRDFVTRRGLNFFLAVLAFFAVFFLCRFALILWRKSLKAHAHRSLSDRAVTLALHALSVVGALVESLVNLNIIGDWFLLGLLVIFLVGVAWLGLKFLPLIIESIKLMLNVGTVKEGERLVFDDIPWRVDSLGFTVWLTNPLLDDGRQSLPVRALMEQYSRPFCEGEALFPTKRGDWVRLADDRIGKVLTQNPSHVVLEELGGALIHYQTADFVAQTPKCLGPTFRMETRFGVDYQHQAICTTEIPEKMQAKLEAEIPKVVPPETIVKIFVEFASAAASALEYEIEVDLTEAAAPLYEDVEFAMQRILVDACNENGWVIPFTQVTIHQASS